MLETKLYQPGMSYAFLTDSVYVSLASLYSCTTAACSVNCTIN